MNDTTRIVVHVQFTRPITPADKEEVRKRVRESLKGLKDLRESWTVDVEEL